MGQRNPGYDDTGYTSVHKDLFLTIAAKLGYRPETVMSIRINPKECHVVWKDYETGMPRSQKHEVVL